MINILYIKIASRIDKKFATETKVNHIVLEIIKIMWVDSQIAIVNNELDLFNEIARFAKVVEVAEIIELARIDRLI